MWQETVVFTYVFILIRFASSNTGTFGLHDDTLSGRDGPLIQREDILSHLGCGLADALDERLHHVLLCLISEFHSNGACDLVNW